MFDERNNSYTHANKKLECQVISKYPNISFDGTSLTVIENGIFNFSGLKIIGEPGTINAKLYVSP